MNVELITSIAIGIGLSASTGFRVFVPMLVASIASRAGIIPLTEGFLWLSSWTAIISFGTATIVEILAYYIPFIDNLLDTITTPMAIVAGTLLVTSVLPVDNELMKWITGTVVGGGAAAAVQSGSVLTRLTSSKLTAGVGNPIVSTGENIAAVGSSILSLIFPLFIVAGFLLLFIYIIFKVKKKHKNNPT